VFFFCPDCAEHEIGGYWRPAATSRVRIEETLPSIEVVGLEMPKP
jgi:hypothetical protein